MDFRGYFVILFLRTRLRAIISFIVIICSAVQGQNRDDDYFTVLPRNITTRLTLPARFDCQTDANTGFVYWTVGGNVMISNASCSGCIIHANGSLYFPSVSRAHANLYTCFILLLSGVSMQPRPARAYLTVAEDPEITSPASDIIVNQNEMLEINVQVTGVPQPNITWRKGSVNLDTNSRFTFNGSNLILPNAQHTDAGVYTVRAENIANTVEESYNVVVQFLPIIEITRIPDRDMIEEDTVVTVSCTVTSNPGSSISWEEVTANERTNKTDQATTQVPANNQFNTESLSAISFTDRDVSGFSKFCCRASNDIGAATKCLNFTETGTPSVPTDFTLTGNTSSSASISWVSSMTGPDIVYNISWTRNGELVNYTTLPSTTMSYMIQGLDADTEYVLMINAINTESGKQSFTATITMRTLVADVSSSVSDDDTVSVAVISGAVVGALLLTVIIIIIIVIIVIIFYGRKNNSERGHSIDGVNNIQLSLDLPHQHTDNTSGKVDPTSKLETVNAVYVPTKVASLDSVLRRIDHRTGGDVTITPNPSYGVSNSPPQSGQKSEDEYDYVLIADDDEVVKRNQSTTTSGGGEVNVDIDPNPSYSVAQDVKLQDNPSYDAVH